MSNRTPPAWPELLVFVVIFAATLAGNYVFGPTGLGWTF